MKIRLVPDLSPVGKQLIIYDNYYLAVTGFLRHFLVMKPLALNYGWSLTHSSCLSTGLLEGATMPNKRELPKENASLDN